MSDVAKKVGGPSLPSVNLIPPEIAERTKLRTIRAMALFAVLVAVVVVVVGYVLALGTAQLASNSLDDALVDQQAAIDTRDSKVGVYDTYRGYEQSAWTLGQIGYGDIDVASLTYSVLGTADDTTSFDRVQFRGPTAVSLGPVASGVDGVPGVGSIEFSARAQSYETATSLVARMEALPGIEDVIVTTEIYVVEELTFLSVEGTATVTDVALSQRFIDPDSVVVVDPEAALSDEEPVEEVAPSPSPTPTAEVE